MELKAMAFEQIQQRDQATANINAILQELQKRQNNPSEPEPKNPEL